MILFRRKTPYTKAVEDVARRALDTPILELLGLTGSPAKRGACAVDELEATAAVFFFLERALRSLSDPANRERATEHLRNLVFAEVGRRYSEAEVTSRVVPLFQSRIQRYRRIIEGPGELGDNFYALAGEMTRNILGQELDADDRAKAARALYRELWLEPAHRLELTQELRGIKWA